MVRRYKGIAGKFIGGCVYVHRQYADLVVPMHQETVELLLKQFPGFQYNVVVWDTKMQTIRFCISTDFDKATEPVVGMTVTVDLLSGSVGSLKEYKQVWHRKELWVGPDYLQFDVQAAERWTLCWSSKLAGKESANGSSRENWIKQLERHGLSAPK